MALPEARNCFPLNRSQHPNHIVPYRLFLGCAFVATGTRSSPGTEGIAGSRSALAAVQY